MQLSKRCRTARARARAGANARVGSKIQLLYQCGYCTASQQNGCGTLGSGTRRRAMTRVAGRGRPHAGQRDAGDPAYSHGPMRCARTIARKVILYAAATGSTAP
ncbi:unnamed protein product [Mycetohabitans rhizoxinica HKI 454]|uniref:Uncharacterized protein n=1 Tax=Mycetohabitans rhizoxinica (strain DSM 19002 / CIP 109453 / HKI 454) TaxID=882378 RepID=E5AS14_MYCRK|nr:unnamed protein product [Mycetohabitans rhizoxinica HKI 454]